MADVQPLRALHYDLSRVGPLGDVVAPPYDVIDPEQRAALAARSRYNVVHIDLPEAGGDPYEAAARQFDGWRREGAVVQDPEPALWALTQAYDAPGGGGRRERHGFLARVRVEEYGAGRVRPHERTHPGPKEDRLRLTRATQANLSPIFALHSDPQRAAWSALEPHTQGDPWGAATDADGTEHRLWRVTDPAAIAAVQDATARAELLIADGHHRYETARVYAEEVGGEGDHRYVLTALVALEDPGLLVFPTHRLVRGLRPEQHETLANAIRESFDVEEVSREALVPEGDGPLRLGYIDAHFKRPFRLTLKDPALADAALPGRPEPYRRLDTAVLEALVLKSALGMSDDDISHLRGLGYARDAADALELVDRGEYDAAFFMRGTPVEEVREVAAAGESMPPKSTYFFPKLLTGMLFNPLGERHANLES
ncbi:MAG: hypothetical protein QOE65_712 [Solirubrobacteraceae bacterium]|jgi:uncharacterized protein (DUF1015 family)|nr:hypothetical protein [Solirubrobacteraceae bacterium]